MATIPKARLDRVEQLYLAGMTPRAIAAAVADEFGCSRRQGFRYVELVKSKLAAQAKAQDPDAARAQILGMLARAYRVAETGGEHGPNPGAMVSSARAMAEVQGLMAPQRFEHTGRDGNPIATHLVAEIVVLPPLDAASADATDAPGALAAEPGAAATLPE